MCVKVKYPVRKSVSVLAVAMLSACGGGGGSSSEGSSLDDPSSGESTRTVSSELAPGVYTVTAKAGEGLEVGLSFLSSTGSYITVLTLTDINYGKLEFSGESTISGNGTDIFLPTNAQGEIIASWQRVEGSLSGTVQTKGTATLTASAGDNSSTVTLVRQDAFSDQGVNLTQISNNYSMVGTDGFITEVTIAPNGELNGSDQDGCIFNGQLTIPDPSFNVYEVAYTASSCGTSVGKSRNGEFTGLGTYDPIEGDLIFAATNGEISALFMGSR